MHSTPFSLDEYTAEPGNVVIYLILRKLSTVSTCSTYGEQFLFSIEPEILGYLTAISSKMVLLSMKHRNILLTKDLFDDHQLQNGDTKHETQKYPSHRRLQFDLQSQFHSLAKSNLYLIPQGSTLKILLSILKNMLLQRTPEKIFCHLDKSPKICS